MGGVVNNMVGPGGVPNNHVMEATNIVEATTTTGKKKKKKASKVSYHICTSCLLRISREFVCYILSAQLASTKEKKPRPKPGEIRETKALDGSTLYCCPECQMAYPDRGLIEQHVISHAVERRFVCDICNAALKRKDHLTRHKLSHIPDRPHVCNVSIYFYNIITSCGKMPLKRLRNPNGTRILLKSNRNYLNYEFRTKTRPISSTYSQNVNWVQTFTGNSIKYI